MRENIAGQTERSFGSLPDIVEIPNLVAIQKKSYDEFLQRDVAPTRRKPTGLEALFRETFPIESYDKKMLLEYLYYELEKPHYTPVQCRQLRLTYGYPLKIWCRLRSKEGEDLAEQAMYLGEIPVMVGGGEFIINGAVRVIVSQLHRSPGVDFLIESKRQLDRDQCHKQRHIGRQNRSVQQDTGDRLSACNQRSLRNHRANPEIVLSDGDNTCK